MIQIFDPLYSDDFWEANRRALNEQTPYPSHTSSGTTGRNVNHTADRVAKSAYNSGRKVDSLLSSELFIVCAIMFTKVILWILYRAAQEEGLEVMDL